MSQLGKKENKKLRAARYRAKFIAIHGISPVTCHRRRNKKLYLVYGARARSRDLGLPCDLSVEAIVWPVKCPILGVDLDYTNYAGKLSSNLPSLDRVDNSRGYTLDNVRVISHRANTLKSNFGAETFRRIADYCEGKI